MSIAPALVNRLKSLQQLHQEASVFSETIKMLTNEQNKISEEKIAYLKDMERKLRQIVIEWKKAEDKNKVVKQIAALLFKKNEQKTVSKKQKQIDSKYEEINGNIKVGDKVKMKRNLQVGKVLELRGKKAVVKIGLLPMQIDLADLSLVKEKEVKE